MCSCSVTPTCRWCTIIGSTSEVSHISHSGEITCLSCARCCRCRWSSRRMEWSRPDSSSSGLLRPAESPEVVDRSPRMTRRDYRRRQPVRVMEPPVENIPVLTIHDPLAAAGAVVLDCRPLLLPVSSSSSSY